MSEARIDSISNEHNTGGPTIAGITTFSGTNYFVPPVGSTGERPENPQKGSIRFNTDTKHLEYFRGNTIGWTEIEASHDQLGGGGGSNAGVGTRGIWAGGTTPTRLSTIQYITISTLGDAKEFGDLNEVKEGGAGCSSRTKAIFAGGYNGPNRTGNSSVVIMASKGEPGVNYNDLSNTVSSASGFGSQTRGIVAGGSTGSLVDVIESTEIAAGTDWVDFGDATAAHQTGSGCASSTRGVYSLGSAPSRVNTIEYIIITSRGDAKDFGDLTSTRNGTGALSNSIRGVWGAGETPSVVNTMDFITLASTGNAVDFGDMLSARFNIPNDGCSSPTRGVWGGGANPGHNAVIQYITIPTTGNAIDFGDLFTAGASHMAAVSNGHGGL